MIDKEHDEMIAKALEVQECIETIEAHDEWICHINEELEKLDVMKPHFIKVSGYTEGEGNIYVDIPLSKKEEVMELIKEKLETEIQDRKIYISEVYEILNSLLK
jgi:hypothetical protein|nr:MAG TPA: hypothetical protein [Caudoviricetes sp.]